LHFARFRVQSNLLRHADETTLILNACKIYNTKHKLLQHATYDKSAQFSQVPRVALLNLQSSELMHDQQITEVQFMYHVLPTNTALKGLKACTQKIKSLHESDKHLTNIDYWWEHWRQISTDHYIRLVRHPRIRSSFSSHPCLKNRYISIFAIAVKRGVLSMEAGHSDFFVKT
jgi:hypothetical protein